MSIYFMGEQAFVDVRDGMLCIGSKAEVNQADEKQLVEMIHTAIVWSQYRSIDTVKGLTLH